MQRTFCIPRARPGYWKKMAEQLEDKMDVDPSPSSVTKDKKRFEVKKVKMI